MQSHHSSDAPILFPKKEQLLLDVKKAATLLCLSPSYLYREARAGRIPAKKIGTCVRFKVVDLTAWIDQHDDVSKCA